MQREPDYSTAGGETNSSRPTVLQVLPSLGSGGVERGTVEIARALVEAGWGAVVASAGGRLVTDLDRIGARHVKLPLDGKTPWLIRRNIGRLAALIQSHEVDLVHVRSRAAAWSARAAARHLGVPLVTTYHSPYGDSWWKRPYNAVMASGVRVIAISDYIAALVRRRHGVEPPRLRRIHRGVDLEAFDPDQVARDRIVELARAWRLPDGAPVVMLPGRLSRWKGQALAIEALAALERRDAILVLLGGDQGRQRYRSELENLIARFGLEERVRLPGHCRDMAAAYLLCDVVLSASLEPEGFGRVSAEAQAMGRPIVASNHGGSPEIVLHEETGMLFESGDVGALAAALERMLSLDAAARQALAAKARSHVARHFSLSRMCTDTLAVYRDVLGGDR